MIKKRYLLLLFSLGISLFTFGQQKNKASDILDQTAATFQEGNGIQITFSDSQQKGILQLQGNKFHLLYGDIESWFDGKTQWSYVKANEEVSIFTPTLEEIQETNPYSIFNTYKNNFNYTYEGTKSIKGKKVHKITLVSRKKKDNIKSVVLYISPSFVPQEIILFLPNGRQHSFIISTYLSGKRYGIDTFRFNPKKYPKAEIIDLR